MSERIIEVIVPQLNVNEETVILVEWYTPDQGKVVQGEPLCGVETTKTAYDIEAPANGYVKHLVKAGVEVKSRQVIALIGSSVEILETKKNKYLEQASAKSNSKQSRQATEKAKKLAKKMNIDLDQISGTGIIREEDVRRAASLKDSSGKTPVFLDEWVIEPGEKERGFIAAEYIRQIEKDPKFASLDSESKIKHYRSHGAYIEDNVVIGDNSIILSQVVQLKEGSRIGSDCFIKTNRFVLGKMSVIGNKNRIVTREVVIGDMLFSGEHILIGGGGAFGPRSRLRVGDNCMISSYCILNTGEPVILGNEVGLSPRVQLYTHNHWQNILEGYIARHAPIMVEDGAYITGNCLVVPGIKIGKGSTVLANSVVSEDVLPYTVVWGVPAKVVSHINTNLSQAQKERIMEKLMRELFETMRYAGFDLNRAVFQPTIDCQNLPKNADVLLTFKIKNLPSQWKSPVIFDLNEYQVYGTQTRLSDEVRNFLRRRGIRFKPIHWRYTHDEGFYIQ